MVLTTGTFLRGTRRTRLLLSLRTQSGDRSRMGVPVTSGDWTSGGWGNKGRLYADAVVETRLLQEGPPRRRLVVGQGRVLRPGMDVQPLVGGGRGRQTRDSTPYLGCPEGDGNRDWRVETAGWARPRRGQGPRLEAPETVQVGPPFVHAPPPRRLAVLPVGRPTHGRAPPLTTVLLRPPRRLFTTVDSPSRFRVSFRV